jgi:hypothetical protein
MVGRVNVVTNPATRVEQRHVGDLGTVATRWWRIRAVGLRTPGVWDVLNLRFDAATDIVERISSGSAGAGYGHDEAFTTGPGRWGGRPDRGGDGSCSIGVRFDRPVVPSAIVLEDAPGDHRAIRVAVECSDDGSAWREVATIDLDPANSRHVVFYAPSTVGASTSWRIRSKSTDPVVSNSIARARFLRRGLDLTADVEIDGGTVTVTSDSEQELDRILVDLPAGVTATSVLLERLGSDATWLPWRHLSGLGPGRNDLLLHDPLLRDEPGTRRPSAAVRHHRSDRRILVLIAAYRDPELADTITSAITRAAFPEHLRFAICHQYDDITRPLLDPWDSDNRFRIDAVDHSESRGCCWARHRTFEMYAGEPYVFQIDAHTRFAARWDVRFIEMLESVDSPLPVLTTYPPRYTFDSDGSVRYDLDVGVQRLYVDEVRDDLTTIQKTTPPPDLARPGPSPTVAAGHIFTRGSFCTDVPYDPEMYFAGEEISMAARAFTAGYDLYHPHQNLVWHRYHHDHPKHWDDHDDHGAAHDVAVERLRSLFRGDHSRLGRFGLGSVRTLAEFEDHTGIDLGAPRVTVDGTVTIEIDRSVIEPRDDYSVFVVVFLDRVGAEVTRREVRAPDVLGLRRSSVRFGDIPPNVSHYLVVPMVSPASGGAHLAEVALRPIPAPSGSGR